MAGSLPAASLGAPNWNDKALHAIGFAVGAWLAARAYAFVRPSASAGAAAWAGLGFGLGLGGVLEVWQALLPWRSAELLDWVADGAGAALAAGIRVGVERRRRA